MDSVSQTEKLQLGSMALDAEWYDLAVLSSIRAKAWDSLDLRFPMPMSQAFSRFAKLQGVDMSLLYALARQESALYHRAPITCGCQWSDAAHAGYCGAYGQETWLCIRR